MDDKQPPANSHWWVYVVAIALLILFVWIYWNGVY